MKCSKHNGCCKRVFIFVPLAIAALFGISSVVMLLWNWVIPSISTLGLLTYWQAMGLLVLSKILFGGMRHGCRDRHHGGHHFQHGPFKDRFMEMSDEEKEAFKSQWKSRCCG